LLGIEERIDVSSCGIVGILGKKFEKKSKSKLVDWHQTGGSYGTLGSESNRTGRIAFLIFFSIFE